MDHPLTRAAIACRAYNRFKALAEKSAISLTECFTVPMRILLVKSDFEDET
ncbi:MAG: hypothetical protein K2N55_04770 [Lachnospiraceae bacterium]|nr:hypothetical protein [Lachnospiraceae bacterium]